MQLSAGPALPRLPHTRARPVHWITTAAVLAAVVVAGALVEPADASPGRSATAPAPEAAHYPLDCAGGPVDVVEHVSGDLDQDGRPETVAVVRCHSETGTPPSGVYVLSRGARDGGAPRLVETLVDPAEQRSVQNLEIQGRTVRATVLGYSGDSVARCCPDQRRPYSWQWRDGTFHVLAGALANSV